MRVPVPVGGRRHQLVDAVGEAHVLAAAVHRQPRGGSGVAGGHELLPDAVPVGGPGVEDALGARLHVGDAAAHVVAHERGLGAQRAEALAEHDQLRPAVRRAAAFQRSATALNSSLPAAWATSLSTSVEIQLGRNEYWMATIAVSPPYIISMARGRVGVHPAGTGDGGDHQDGPVEPAGALEVLHGQVGAALGVVGRLQAGVDADGALHRGASGSPSANACRSASGVARATNVRPWLPRVSHGMSESGLPDTVGSCGCSTPSSVPLSTAPNWLRAQLSNPSNSVRRHPAHAEHDDDDGQPRGARCAGGGG